jgi:hypothetical protein
MVSLAESFAHTSIANVPQFTYPVSDVESGSLMYQGYPYGDVVFPIEPNGATAVDTILDVKPGMNSFTGAALPSPSSVKVTVENGTGITNQAAAIANPLRNRGFDILSTGDVTPDGPVDETMVWYGGPPPPANGNWTSPGLAAAEAVIDQLAGPAVLGYNPHEVTPGATVTIQTGDALSVNPVASTNQNGHHTTTTAKKNGHTTTTSSPTTTTTVYDPPGMRNDPNFAAPNAVSPTLEPWDPRGCNAAGTGPAST